MTQDTQRKLRFFFRILANLLLVIICSGAYGALLAFLPLVWTVLLVCLTIAGFIGYFAWTEAEYKLFMAKMEEERTARHLAREQETF